jgi:hypothetical protein
VSIIESPTRLTKSQKLGLFREVPFPLNRWFTRSAHRDRPAILSTQRSDATQALGATIVAILILVVSDQTFFDGRYFGVVIEVLKHAASAVGIPI